ncbi:uncharacterized [Tachysurus ichikawai]
MNWFGVPHTEAKKGALIRAGSQKHVVISALRVLHVRNLPPYLWPHQVITLSAPVAFRSQGEEETHV